MLFNFGKCKCLHTGSGNAGVNYEIGGTILSKSVKEKDLGVTMNAKKKKKKKKKKNMNFIWLHNKKYTIVVIVVNEKCNTGDPLETSGGLYRGPPSMLIYVNTIK